MARVRSFEPIENAKAEVLVLGSMPGRASLAAGQYYAHSQNAFWRIAGELLRFDPASPYKKKVRALKSARIALWDVLHSCTREGSLDASIESDTQIANDFRKFLQAHKKIRRVFFNGAKAEACFRRHVLPEIDAPFMNYLRLPSTSPANASMSFARKLSAWQVILAPNRAEPTVRKRRLRMPSALRGSDRVQQY
jgi:TDG/mug DNA glycosylase family protein